MKYTIGTCVVLAKDEGLDLPEDALGKLAMISRVKGNIEYQAWVPSIDQYILIGEHQVAREVTRLDDPALHQMSYWH